MSEPLTPERLAELRRIAEAATPGPWIKDADKRYSVRSHWNPPRDGNVVGWRVCVVSGNGPQSDADWDYITEFNPKTALALLDRIEQLEADNNKLECENGELYRRIERLEAKLARQRVMLTKLQSAIERRATGDWVEATRRAMADEVVERHVREADVALDEAERWRQKYEALRARVERVVQDLHERAHAAARDWQQSGHPYHDGASDAYYEAEQMVRRVLSEAGGGEGAGGAAVDHQHDATQ